MFANGALSGSPIHLVSGLILTKWKALGYDSGPAGVATGDVAAFSTIGANSGNSQTFAQGAIYAATAGPRAGQAYFVSGLILAAFTGAVGASGSLGMPVSDETVSGTVHTQSFEGGSISYSVGDTVATVKQAPKVPAVQVAPAVVSAGGHAVFAITGFNNNTTVRVSMTGQPDFLVTTPNGAYSWDTYVPLTAQGGAVAIHAADTKGTSTADGTLTVRSLAAGQAGTCQGAGGRSDGLPGATAAAAAGGVGGRFVGHAGDRCTGEFPGVAGSAAFGVQRGDGQHGPRANVRAAAGFDRSGAGDGDGSSGGDEPGDVRRGGGGIEPSGIPQSAREWERGAGARDGDHREEGRAADGGGVDSAVPPESR